MVGAYCSIMSRALPPLRTEPPAFLLLPMTIISGAASLFLYPVLCRQRGRSIRAFTLYVGFVLTTLVYGIYLWIFIPDGTAWLIVLSLLAGHLYGLPLFFALLVTHLLMAPLVFPRAGGSDQGRWT